MEGTHSLVFWVLVEAVESKELDVRVVVFVSAVPAGVDGEAADVLAAVTDSTTSGLTTAEEEEDANTPVGTPGLVVVVWVTPVSTAVAATVAGARAVVLEVSTAELEVEGTSTVVVVVEELEEEEVGVVVEEVEEVGERGVARVVEGAKVVVVVAEVTAAGVAAVLEGVMG